MLTSVVLAAISAIPASAGWSQTSRCSGLRRWFDRSCKCDEVTVQDNFNITEYVRASWFVQRQQITAYLPEESNYCVVATYELEDKKVPFFDGKVASVYNYANRDEVNGPSQNAAQSVLCARQLDESEPAKLSVAPCYLPNALAGDYWVVAAGPSPDNYEWAIVSGGQPENKAEDGGCTNKERGVNGSGFWFFTRAKVASQETLSAMEQIAVAKGFSLSLLENVEQEGCEYDGARIKSSDSE